MIRFVDAYREEHGVEPICRVIKIAPSTYHAHMRRRANPDPDTVPERVRRDAALRPEIQRVFDDRHFRGEQLSAFIRDHSDSE